MLFSDASTTTISVSRKGQLTLRTPQLFRDFEVHELIAEERQKVAGAPFLDFGPPLPSGYGVDRLHLMAQSPTRVFAYWEVTGPASQLALSRFPVEERQSFHLMLKWRESGMPEQWFDVGTTSSWWFTTAPQTCCQAELALFSEDWGWVSLLKSQPMFTPRNTLGPASMTTTEPEARVAFLQDLVRQTGIEPGQPVPSDQPTAVQTEPEAALAMAEPTVVVQGEEHSRPAEHIEIRPVGSCNI